ncbi:MAG TPA: pseudouridine synthase [Elusimicrobia bacterium]|nr:pseudouridine synthase [Elusimicrobiota bacterium]
MQASHNIIRMLSKLGFCSRKQAVEYVRDGRVTLNGRVTTSPGQPATPKDKILVDGKPPARQEKICILLNKPAGCVTTRSDELGRKTVYDYLDGAPGWIFPVGRLDLESEGLLVFTNDTALGNRLTDPRYRIPRTYKATIDGILLQRDMERIIHGGIDIGRGEFTGPAKISPLSRQGGAQTLEITITEGKNREIRRMFEALGRRTLRLERTCFGPFKLGNIPSGSWRAVPIPKDFSIF